MYSLVRVIDALNGWVGKILCWLLIPLTAITAYEVFMRYVMKNPTIWAWDVNLQIFTALIFLGGGYALLENAHVTVDVLTMNMDKRKLAILNIITSAFFFLGICVLLIAGFEMFKMSWIVKERTATIWAPPYYWMKLLVPVGAFLLLLQGISNLIKNIYVLLGREVGK